MIREAWNFSPHSNPMQAFSHLLSRARHRLLDWKSKGCHNIDSRISNLEASILEAEDRDGFDDGNEFSPQSLSIMYNNLSALHRQNSTKWAQRARLLWVQNGDNNSSFFFNSIRFRNHYSLITNIMDVDNSIYTDQPAITRTFINFSLICGMVRIVGLCRIHLTCFLMIFLKCPAGMVKF